MEIESILNRIKKNHIPISKIEKDLNMPTSTLAKAKSGERKLPNKWLPKIDEYLQEYCKAKEIGILLGSDKNEKLGNPPKKIFSLHDITCSADPAKPMGTEGCSCEMYRRAKKAEKEVEELQKQLEKATGRIHLLENKAHSAPKTEKEGKITQNQEITQEEAEKCLKKKYEQLPGFLKPENITTEVQKGLEQAKTNSKELSPFLKSRQNAKNGM